MNKQTWMHAAEVIDSMRLFPRFILVMYGWFVFKVTFFVLIWYTKEPAAARGVEESAVVGVIFSAIAGFFPSVLKIYVDSGRSWDQKASSTTVASMTTTATGAPAAG